jgi:hypothetical protein
MTQHALHGSLRAEPALCSWQWVAACGLWFAVVLTGTWFMTRYSQTPGASAEAPKEWPAASHIPRDTASLTLIMFAHPHCPCSRGSIGELDEVMARCQGRVRAQVWFLQPEGKDQDWAKTDLWRTAEAIPGVTVRSDADGSEARLFRAETSGQTLLYASDGSLIFQGGITGARGHSGDNAGRSALMASMERGSAKSAKTAVFGCGLFGNQCPRKDVPCTP